MTRPNESVPTEVLQLWIANYTTQVAEWKRSRAEHLERFEAAIHMIRTTEEVLGQVRAELYMREHPEEEK